MRKKVILREEFLRPAFHRVSFSTSVAENGGARFVRKLSLLSIATL